MRTRRCRPFLTVLVVTSPLLLAAGVGTSCAVRSVDLGANFDPTPPPPPIEAGGAPDVREATAELSYEERLRRLCAEPAGPRDVYRSAVDLTNRVSGVWYHCQPSTTPLTGSDGVSFGADGRWAMLYFDAARTSLVPTEDPDEKGTYDYLAFSDPDAGAGADGGGGSRVVRRDDPTPRSGLFVYLHRGLSIDISVLLDFESQPRRMLLRDVGASTQSATYVAVP